MNRLLRNRFDGIDSVVVPISDEGGSITNAIRSNMMFSCKELTFNITRWLVYNDHSYTSKLITKI